MNQFTGDSLSGQNMGRRAAGTGSSPVLPTKSQRTKLWHRMRRMDGICARSQKAMSGWRPFVSSPGINAWYEGARVRFEKADKSRKEIRSRLKGH